MPGTGHPGQSRRVGVAVVYGQGGRGGKQDEGQCKLKMTGVGVITLLNVQVIDVAGAGAAATAGFVSLLFGLLPAVLVLDSGTRLTDPGYVVVLRPSASDIAPTWRGGTAHCPP